MKRGRGTSKAKASESPWNFDPLPEEREYYRHRATGDRAFKVVRDGVPTVRLDRPDGAVLDAAEFKRGVWLPEAVDASYSPAQVAMFCFESDKALCRLLGLHNQVRKEWLSLPDSERQQWMFTGPRSHPLRARLWQQNQVLMGNVEPD